ncbi:hypothetical protein SADUNF_Sadunf19G0017300 [Salix dunnii]|uniref:phosphoribosylaminoimidazole carboxylase n=1 Tax=Salix dunnii TaxID=1413687 RepID=A0A835MC50_9ROSI|nr:hypothetical protein SADUNF_Sadunf19G0017300 [Salix dunnii]
MEFSLKERHECPGTLPVTIKNQCLTMIILAAIVLGSCSQQIFAARPFSGDRLLKQILGNIPSLDRAPVPPIGGSPCTHIPEHGSGHCPIGAMNFAGHAVARAPPAFPDAVVSFGEASVTSNESQKQDLSSGVPVATVAINNATNAGLLAVRMLGVGDTDLSARMSQYQEDTRDDVMKKAEKLQTDVIILAAIVLGSCSQQILAARPFSGERLLKQNLGNIQSLNRAPVPPIGGSPCTHIPGHGSGHCPLGEMNFAGHDVARAPPAFPDAVRKNQCLTVIILVAIVLGSCSQQIFAARPFSGERLLKQNLGNIQSLDRSPVPSSGGSSCTHIPGHGSGDCPLGEMNFAGHAVAQAPPAFPDAVVSFGEASVTSNETQKQDSSS